MSSSIGKKAVVAAAGIGAAAVAWKAWKRGGARRNNAGVGRSRRIGVLGAGFGGMTVARELCNLTTADGPEIWLVDRNNFLLFTPMLTEVAGGELDPRHILAAPRHLSDRIRFLPGDVQQIDLARKRVTVRTGVDGDKNRDFEFDHIVVALGSVSNYHHIPGLEEHSVGMKSIEDAVALHDRVLRCVETASMEPDAAVRRELLTFVVGGGGYTGVETMAAINDLARDAADRHRRISRDDVATIIAEPAERLLPELSAELASFAQSQLERNGVKVLLKTGITRASESDVELNNGQQIRTRTLVWAGGVQPNPLVSTLDCKRGHHGGIVVDSCCAVPEHAGVWALGDCAEVPERNAPKSYAPTAQNATREGELVARNIVAVLRGASPQPFTYNPIGEVALVGRHSGVAKLYGRRFSGVLAWAMWRAIYLSKMPSAAQRSRIALDWLLDFVFGRNDVALWTRGRISAPHRIAVPAHDQ